MAKKTPLNIEDHALLRILDTLDRNGPLTFQEICQSADVNSIVVNNDLYVEDDLGPPYNYERGLGQLYRITKLGKALIRQFRFLPIAAPRTLPERVMTKCHHAIGTVCVRLIGDETGFKSEPAGTICTIKSLKDGMVWYLYDNQKKRYGRCSKPFCLPADIFDANFKPHEE